MTGIEIGVIAGIAYLGLSGKKKKAPVTPSKGNSATQSTVGGTQPSNAPPGSDPFSSLLKQLFGGGGKGGGSGGGGGGMGLPSFGTQPSGPANTQQPQSTFVPGDWTSPNSPLNWDLTPGGESSPSQPMNISQLGDDWGGGFKLDPMGSNPYETPFGVGVSGPQYDPQNPFDLSLSNDGNQNRTDPFGLNLGLDDSSSGSSFYDFGDP